MDWYKLDDPRFLAQERQICEHYAERMYQRSLQPDLQQRFWAACANTASFAEQCALHKTFWKAQPEIKALKAEMYKTLCLAEWEYDREAQGILCPRKGMPQP
jgi:glutathione S-transferase